jgi:hypothetical protein
VVSKTWAEYLIVEAIKDRVAFKEKGVSKERIKVECRPEVSDCVATVSIVEVQHEGEETIPDLLLFQVRDKSYLQALANLLGSVTMWWQA